MSPSFVKLQLPALPYTPPATPFDISQILHSIYIFSPSPSFPLSSCWIGCVSGTIVQWPRSKSSLPSCRLDLIQVKMRCARDNGQWGNGHAHQRVKRSVSELYFPGQHLYRLGKREREDNLDLPCQPHA